LSSEAGATTARFLMPLISTRTQPNCICWRCGPRRQRRARRRCRPARLPEASLRHLQYRSHPAAGEGCSLYPEARAWFDAAAFGRAGMSRYDGRAVSGVTAVRAAVQLIAGGEQRVVAIDATGYRLLIRKTAKY
jgi:hypothetical protein